jgi:hypothetical protein
MWNQQILVFAGFGWNVVEWLDASLVFHLVNEDDNSFFLMNDSKWKLDSKSTKEKKVSENNWKLVKWLASFKYYHC